MKKEDDPEPTKVSYPFTQNFTITCLRIGLEIRVRVRVGVGIQVDSRVFTVTVAFLVYFWHFWHIWWRSLAPYPTNTSTHKHTLLHKRHNNSYKTHRHPDAELNSNPKAMRWDDSPDVEAVWLEFGEIHDIFRSRVYIHELTPNRQFSLGANSVLRTAMDHSEGITRTLYLTNPNPNPNVNVSP